MMVLPQHCNVCMQLSVEMLLILSTKSLGSYLEPLEVLAYCLMNAESCHFYGFTVKSYLAEIL